MNLKRFLILNLTGLIFIFGMISGAFAQDTDEQYVRNEWNFIDQSMDISKGIPADAGGVLGRIRDRRTLRVATEPYFPPQEFIDPAKVGFNRFVGSDIKLAQLIADRMGVTLEIVPMDFSEVLASLDENTCDLAISALSFVPSRASSYELSKGYYYSEDNAGNGILIRSEDQDKFTSINDFSDKTIAAQRGSLQESLMAENFPGYKEFIRFSSAQEVYTALENGKIDAAMVDIETAQDYIEKGTDTRLMLLPDFQFQLEEQFKGDRIAAKKGQLQLIYFVNAVIDEVLESGQYMEWYKEAEDLARSLGL